MTDTLKAPFVYFGGKSRIAHEIWPALGPVAHYVEPFMGSLAVLLARPDDEWQDSMETVNDKDAFLCNAWRSIKADPAAVAEHCDWPVNETDLYARHTWLVNTGADRIAQLEADPGFYDAKVAGWWLWGINAWIGSGWCGGAVHRQLPHLGSAGQGVHRQHGGLLEWFEALAMRLRRVRVCCGDWSRVVTDGALSEGSTVGVFLDPPYAGAVRKKDIYRTDDHDIAVEVRDWAVAHGENPRYRIVLCGYDDEHAAAMPRGWRVHVWKAGLCMGRASGDTANSVNRTKERLWFSPHCLDQQPHLL